MAESTVALGGGTPDNPTGTFEAPTGNIKVSDWLYRSKAASGIWLVARLWLGYGWLSAGYQKLLWRPRKARLLEIGGGAAVKGVRYRRDRRIDDGEGRRLLRMVGRLPAQLRGSGTRPGSPN